MTSVKSSNIESYSYDIITCTLTILFLSGGMYEYYNVETAIASEFMDSVYDTNKSYGKNFHRLIKKYEYKRVN